jgi:phosphatidylglycerol:prolipoprotein diacylglycerol transferase
MCSELFRIPYVWGGVPIFGFGVLLAVWALAGIGGFVIAVRRQGWNAETLSLLPLLLLTGAAIVGLPRIFPDGLPVRGYGVMVLAGAATGVWMATYRARRAGIDREIIWSMAFWLFIGGMVGGRVFYVIEYWGARFRTDSFRETLLRVINFPEGGLVVYGALIGGVIAVLAFIRKHKLPALATFDLIAPSMAVGLALGRIGCFLNGCCYGGPTDLPWGVSFPLGSPPYADQLTSGALSSANPPPYSLPVHPAQLYSAITAALIGWVLWSYYPFRRRDGQVIALMCVIYPISRFLEEIIRTDEPAVFGTGLSISQNISLAVFVAGIGLWFYLSKQPPHLVWPEDSVRPDKSSS